MARRDRWITTSSSRFHHGVHRLTSVPVNKWYLSILLEPFSVLPSLSFSLPFSVVYWPGCHLDSCFFAFSSPHRGSSSPRPLPSQHTTSLDFSSLQFEQQPTGCHRVFFFPFHSAVNLLYVRHRRNARNVHGCKFEGTMVRYCYEFKYLSKNFFLNGRWIKFHDALFCYDLFSLLRYRILSRVNVNIQWLKEILSCVICYLVTDHNPIIAHVYVKIK